MLTSLRRLREQYGERDARRVLAAIELLLQAREQRGVQSRLIFFEPMGSGSAGEVAGQLLAAVAETEQAGDRIESLLIIGGPAIIPFEYAANPVEGDGDDTIPTDRIYGTRDPQTLMPEWPVGRLPGAETPGANGELLVRLLRGAARMHALPATHPFAKTFGYSTAAWRDASARVYREFGNSPLLVSPPVAAATLNLRLLNAANAVYCNLHGVRDGAVWYGQDNAQYFVALRAEDLVRIRLDRALVLSEACYGAAIGGHDERSSLALAFLGRGAACFIGATALAYGPAMTPLSEADLIAWHFWRVVQSGGTTIGAAFSEARAQMLLETLQRQPTLDDDDEKTVLEFVLYGDPTLPV